MPCRLSTGSLPPQALSPVPEEPPSLHGSSSTSSLTEDKLMELCQQQQQQQQGPACSGGVPLCREARQDRESLDSDFLLQLGQGPRKGRSRPSRGDSARGELMRQSRLCCTNAALSGPPKDEWFTCSVMCHGSPYEWTTGQPHSLCCCEAIHHALVLICGRGRTCISTSAASSRPAHLVVWTCACRVA